MKKLLSLLLIVIILFTGCAQSAGGGSVNTSSNGLGTDVSGTIDSQANYVPQFTGLDDPNLLKYYEDSVYSGLIAELDNSDYYIENVKALYVSDEYIKTLEFNSQSNIYFGYTEKELEDQFSGRKYIFTLGDNGQTVVEEFKEYDDTFNRVLKNIAIGTGVILLCITVSIVTGGLGAPAISMIFAASAKTATTFALSSAAISGAAATITTGIQTGDVKEAFKAGALAGSEGFKWGAISGALIGGAEQAIALHGATLNGLKMNEAALIQKESKYPLDVIKEFKSMEQYEICKKAGLVTRQVNGKSALVRKIDLDYYDPSDINKITNLQRMQKGQAPLDPISNKAYELHHIGQKNDATLAVLTKAEHMQGGNNKIWHEVGKASEVDHGGLWQKVTKDFWKYYSEHYSDFAF